MNYHNDNDEIADSWQWLREFTRKWWQVTALMAIILLAVALKACGQEVERGKTVSAEKQKRSTVWIVCIQSESGKRYSMKWNAHYYGKSANIPSSWDVLTKKNNRVFIKSVV